ncbi:GNAT family N-acetyltransferase [Roseomonas gilardii subsp. gilardii]|uniref:GNAT family N-acetyltransferase n=1 Tax=Roseomonas gilardii TaxID=257708 RepID=UPI001FFBAB2C|nr:GNAT family N-acetyltransferase [Roseomonas gilardii]UPG71136.1 GNAT family N-acetyltransferase [Roseomonas gilardii subsp. gilardii]
MTEGPGEAAPWRAMAAADLASVGWVAERVHADYPEDAAVFAERLSLFPEGCLVLAPASGGIGGYVIAHPWQIGQPPALNSLLGALPAAPDTLYIHDIALLPDRRGGGAAMQALARLEDLARRQGLPGLSLVAVGGSPGFWLRRGFREQADEALHGKLRSYDGAARYMVKDLAAG